MTTDEHENDVATPAAEIDPADLVCYVGPVEKRAEALAHIDRALREHPPADRIVESWLPESLAAETRDAAYSVQVREEDALHRVEIFFTGRSGDELQFGVTSSREIVNAWAAWSEPPPGPSAQPSREARIEEIVRRCASAGGHLGPSAVRSRSSSSR